MALSTDKKLYIALGILVVLGGALYLQRQKQQEERAGYTLEGKQADLPKVGIGEAQQKKIDSIEITQPAGDAGKPEKVVLKKQGDDWQLVEPLTAPANANNVKSLLDNLKNLDVKERIDPSAKSYKRYGLKEGEPVHVVAKAGDKALVDLYFGQGGTRGQMTRIAGKDGVYAVDGYSSFMYSRDLKGWRDLGIFEFDSKLVKQVEITNENGSFVFAKDGDEWTGKHDKKKIAEFDPKKVEDMLRAYKSLKATDFAQKKTKADVGLEEPVATVTITLEDGGKRTLVVGANAEGSNRWAQKQGDGVIWSISSFAADWATAEAKKFQKPEEGEDDEGGKPPAMPMGMPGMPGGMPGGMPPGAMPPGGH